MLKRFLFSCLVAAAAAVLPASAMTVLPVTLDNMIDGAATAFQGTVLENRVARDPQTGHVVTYTRFKVNDVLKGQVGRTHEIKQFGGDLEDSGVQFRMMGVPRFKEGGEYVVFLYGTSTAGFSSPVGLHQGRFAVRQDGAKAKVGNGRDFRELTAGAGVHRLPPSVQQKVHREGAVQELDLDELKQMVRDRLAVTRGTAGSVR